MKYVDIYNNLNINYECNTLFGKFYKEQNFTIKINGDIVYIKNNVYHNIEQASYGEVDETKLYKDVLKYGEKLYRILSKDLNNIFDNDHFTSILVLNCVSNCNINKNRYQLIPICLEFINDYNIPIDMGDLNNSNIEDNCISVCNLVNYLIIMYIINLIFSKLGSDYDKYKEAYKVLNINNDFSKGDILNVLANFFNTTTGSSFKLGIYKISILKMDDEHFVPIRYTTNLFTFVWEILQNNLSSLSFCDKFESENKEEYLVFKKCSICLKNITKPIETDIDSEKIPSTKLHYCENCTKKRKRIISAKYEKTLRELYDYLKENLNILNCNKKEESYLFREIINLPPKDVVKKKKLISLKNKMDIIINKSNRN